MKRNGPYCLVLFCLWASPPLASLLTASGEETGLLGHWKFAGNANDSSDYGNHGANHGADLTAHGPGGQPNSAARFDGKSAVMEIPASESLELGDDDFSLAVWVHTEEKLDDAIGDLVSKFDPAMRRGFNWCIKNSPGASGNQANYRNIHFGVDSGTEPKWTDCGRPGNAVYVMALAVHNGELFAGTCEPGEGEAGHVYRYAGGTRWEDCGHPDGCNAVTTLASYQGKLYAGTGRYRTNGSALDDSPNTQPGGKVFRYDGNGKWTDCGRLNESEAIGGLVVFRGELYATTMYHPAGMFRYMGEDEWAACSLPRDMRRVVSPVAFNGRLYAATYDACAIYRFDGESWEGPITLESGGQTYSLEVHSGQLYAGTWPNGRVYRSSDGQAWFDAGQLGAEEEVMGMAVHNGKLYGGTLPLAEVHRYDAGATWTNTGRLDHTPNVRFRRAWTMAVFEGRLFCGTLPSGHVHALDVGVNVTYDHELRPGWRHLAALREGNRLRLFVDGQQVAASSADPSSLNLKNGAPLRIGLGGHDYFRGSLSDLRLYGRALAAEEIADLAAAHR